MSCDMEKGHRSLLKQSHGFPKIVMRRRSEMRSSPAKFVAPIEEFVAPIKEYMKDADSQWGLRMAFRVLSGGKASAPVTAHLLSQAMASCGLKLELAEVVDVIRMVKNGWIDGGTIECKDFHSIINLARFLEVMKKDANSEKGLKDAFHILSEGRTIASITTAILCYSMKNRDMQPTTNEVDETIRQVKPNWKSNEKNMITFKEFDDIIECLKRLGRFFEAIKKGRDSNEELEAAFHVLSRGNPTASITTNVLYHVMNDFEVKLDPIEEIKKVTHLVKQKWDDEEKFSCRELSTIIKLGKFFTYLMTMNDSEEQLKDAFYILSERKTIAPVTAQMLHHVIAKKWDMELTTEEVRDTVLQVKPDWKDGEEIDFEEFKNIIDGLKRLGNFFKAMKQDINSYEKREIFSLIPSKDAETPASITINVLHRIIKDRHEFDLTRNEVKDTVLLLKSDWKEGDKITFEQFNVVIKYLDKVNKFLVAMKKVDVMKEDDHLDSKLEVAFDAFREDGDSAPITAYALRYAMKDLLTTEEVYEAIFKIKPDWKKGESITFKDFTSIIKSLTRLQKFVETMKTDVSDKGLDNAFKILSEDNNVPHISADLLRHVMENRNVKLEIDEVVDTMHLVKPNWKEGDIATSIENFKEVFKQLKERKCRQLNKRTVVDQLEEIYGHLTADQEIGDKVVLHGKPGVGKTWMVRKVAYRSIRRRKFDHAIWIYPKRIHAGRTLQDSIAKQLSLQLDFHTAKANAAKRYEEEKKQQQSKMEGSIEEEEKKEKELGKEEKGIKELEKEEKAKEVERKIHDKVKDKKLLLIYDDDDDEDNARTVKADVRRVLGLDTNNPMNHKDLITKQSLQEQQEGMKVIQVLPWTWDDAWKVVEVDDDLEMKELAHLFISKTERHPDEVLVIAKTMNHFRKSESGWQKMRRIRELLDKQAGGGSSNVIQLLLSEYDPIPKSILIDCYSSMTSEKHFLQKGHAGLVNYQELISYWIIEGHLGKFDCIEDAYEEGYRVLTELLDCELLRKLDDNYVMSSSKWKLDYNILVYDEFFRGIQLGMGNTFDCKMGRIAVAEGMMRTVDIGGEREQSSSMQKGEEPSGSGQEKKKLSTLMLDGNHFEVPGSNIFEVQEEYVADQSPSELEKIGCLQPHLKNLVIFNPTINPFPLPVDKLKKLRLLVLRGCRYLEKCYVQVKVPQSPTKKSLPNECALISIPEPSTDQSKLFEKLEVLEISGPSPLNELHDILFNNILGLKSVNLSSLEIKSLPKSFYHLTEVESLIIKGCESLEVLESLGNFKKLQLLDLSGSTSLTTIKEKNFSQNPCLRIINFSNTKLHRVPLIQSLGNLISLRLGGCTDLLGIRKVSGLHNLQIFDISGSMKVEEFLDPLIHHLDSIEVLDVSRTSIIRLPGTIGNPRILKISDCLKLVELLPIESLKRVEVLDVSGCCNLVEIKVDFLATMKSLRELNLSKTNIKKLPSSSSLLELRRLWLSNCQCLEAVEQLRSFEKLEVLDLLGCKALKEIEDGSFDKMDHLETLDLSEIELDRLPSLSNLNKLKELKVKDCPNLTDLPGIEELKALETLDHSGTTLKSQPSFKSPLCRPNVTGPIAEHFDRQKLLQELGASNAEAPYAQGDGAENHVTQEGLDQFKCNWKISAWNADQERLGMPHDGTHFLQLLETDGELLKKHFSQFHFLLVPSDGRIKTDESSYRDEIKLRHLYFKQLSEDKMQKCLEIRRFQKSPNHVRGLLKEAESIFLIDNPFCQSLFNLDHDEVKAMKLCWIERCNEMEYLICSAETTEGADSFSKLETLWVSDVKKLKGITNREIPGFSFRGLKNLYLEFCPELSTICSELGTLEILWGLPALEKIECNARLRTLRVGDCCLLERAIFSTQNLDTLHIKSCDKLKTISESSDTYLSDSFPELRELELWALPELQTVAKSVPKLETLRVGECHSMECLFDSDELPSELSNLEVKSCEKLKTIGRGKELEWQGLEKMKLKLMCLPELDIKIRGPVPTNDPDHTIWACPKLDVDRSYVC